jgi:hypothetical protein
LELEEAMQIELKALNDNNKMRRKKKRTKETGSKVKTENLEDDSLSATFLEFRDKWERKLCKWEKTMEEIEGADMSLSELESYKEVEFNEAVNTAGKDVPKEKGVIDMGDTSAKTTVVPKEVPTSMEEASGKDTIPGYSAS